MSNYTPHFPIPARGLATPKEAGEIPEDEAEAIVEQQTPLFEDEWKCGRIDKLPRF